MNQLSRRHFLRLAGGIGAASAVGGWHRKARAAASARVVVIGAGFGGATCARYLRKADPGIAVTIVEPNQRVITCPFSNLVLGGLRTMESITHKYDGLRREGIEIVHAHASAIDPKARTVKLSDGKSLSYDRLVVAPGISFKWKAIEGYGERAAQTMPHAWTAGAQTTLLQKKLQAMKDGGVVVIAAPPNPFRCPPGPYERASMIAHYLTQHKPKSKILILDAKDQFSKQGLFLDGWSRLYPEMIEWIPVSKGGGVRAVDAKKMLVETELDAHQADVANIIPPQAAGEIAHRAGLTNETGFCPVDPKTFESKKQPGIHVVGDAAIAGTMPKSAFAANSQAKLAAAAIVAALRGGELADATFVNTCYSLIGPQYGISIVGVYRIGERGISDVPGAGGVSPRDADADFRRNEAKYAEGWYAGITADTWAV